MIKMITVKVVMRTKTTTLKCYHPQSYYPQGGQK